jgi:Asp-tRNA(Asn)/Glu-tRNA(Gln) amidotransferase A subunit family amidase
MRATRDGDVTRGAIRERGQNRSRSSRSSRSERSDSRQTTFNLTGPPAATVPVGFTPAGLPVGLQIVGRRFADLTVLQASAAYEAARPWAGRRPPLD